MYSKYIIFYQNQLLLFYSIQNCFIKRNDLSLLIGEIDISIKLDQIVYYILRVYQLNIGNQRKAITSLSVHLFQYYIHSSTKVFFFINIYFFRVVF